MQANRDFTVEPFKRKPEFRSDKGKKHCYPKQRERWNLISHGQTDTNLTLNETTEQYTVMDTAKTFKNPPEIRNYWKLHKRQQRDNKAQKAGATI